MTNFVLEIVINFIIKMLLKCGDSVELEWAE